MSRRAGSDDPARSEATRLTLASTSRAADGGYLALADLAAIAADLAGVYRVVGGHMVTLLVARQGVSDQVPLRETLDADFGAPPQVIADPRLPQALTARQYARRGAATRFARSLNDAHGPLDVVIDILAPSYRSGMRSGRQHGGIVVDEIPGLAFALSRPPEFVDLQVRLTSGRWAHMCVAVPDLASALCIKALAYRGRLADKDAVDLWRLMNAAHAAGLRYDSWPTGVTGRTAAQVIMRFFGRRGATGLSQVSKRRPDQTRMQALVRAIVAEP